jgi:hypothetical protein
MDYSAILNKLNSASLFELYRLNASIHQQLKDPNKIHLIKNSLKTGQWIQYFESSENRLIDAEILELNKTRLLVKNKHDGKTWNIPYYFINIDHSDTDIHAESKQKMGRNNLKVGDKVCFKDKKGNEVFGEVTKLNQKTAGVLVGHTKWRVAYSLLSPIIDGDLGSNKALLEGEVLLNHQSLITKPS